jgi:hypothetical protein
MGNASVKGAAKTNQHEQSSSPASSATGSLLKRSLSTTSSVGTDTKNVRFVKEKFCEAMNRQDVATIRKFASPGSIFCYKGAETGMLLRDFLEAVIKIFESFPDNVMVWDSIEETSPGVVVVTNFQGKGTHTGKPFSFGQFPSIAATGIKVEEDPCHLTITVEHNKKMSMFVVDTYCGDLVGPPGYYNKIGGDLRD